MPKRAGLIEAGGPKYRNPDNPAQTWSGKGKRPAWVKAALAAGKSLESLEIHDDRPVTKFERRGERLGHEVFDLEFTRQ